MENDNKLWCKEYQDYYGNPDPQYGGKLTNLRKLPVGTEFWVANGWWKGKILSESRMLVYCPTGDFVVELTDKHHALYLG